MGDMFAPIGSVIRAARKERGLTQTALGKKIGATQSAISALEAGRADVLGKDKILKLASLLEIDLESVITPTTRTLRYCPDSGCPTNTPYVIGNDLVYRPTFLHTEFAGATWCNICGEVLERSCPDPACNAAITEGMFCTVCGHRYVSLPVNFDPSDVADLEEWAAARRERNEEILRMHSVHGRGKKTSTDP